MIAVRRRRVVGVALPSISVDLVQASFPTATPFLFPSTTPGGQNTIEIGLPS
jgi:hypothetical protein